MVQTVNAFVKMNRGESKKAFSGKKTAMPRFNLSVQTDAWCTAELRMSSGNVKILREHMGIPRDFRTANRDKSSGDDALCMLLFRLSRPRKCKHLREIFGGSAQRITRISNALAVYLYNRFKLKLESLDRHRLTDEYLISLARAQFKSIDVMQNIVGFVDATALPCCRLVPVLRFPLLQRIFLNPLTRPPHPQACSLSTRSRERRARSQTSQLSICGDG